jgi:hypothetical protein
MAFSRKTKALAVLVGMHFFLHAGTATAQSTAKAHNLSLPYLGWSYPGTPGTLETDLKFLADPGPNTKWFLSHQFVLEDANAGYSTGGYIGMQTNIQNINAKGVMFSIWNATSAKPASGATCQPFSGEGVGMQCYLPYSWVAGKTYRLRVVNDRSSAYSAYVIDTSTATPTVTYIGQIQAPTAAVNLGRNSVQWAEYYAPTPANCADFPYVKAQWSRPKGDGGSILGEKPAIQYAEAAYCKNTAVTASGTDYIMEGGNPAAGNRQHLTNSTGKYLNQVPTDSTCGGAGVKADAGTITACTGLTRIPMGSGKFALQAENGNYLSCSDSGTVTATSRTIANNETFTETAASGKVSYKSNGGRYLTVASWGTLDLKCSAYFAGTTEKFTPFTNKASTATVTVSSDNPSTGQTASKAIDGAATGYPNDYTREWTTNGENVGAWIQLKWAAATAVKQVILYDRPNLDDQILGGTLLFSDGSSIPVGALPNDGSPLAISFTAKNVTWVKFRVDKATGWIGLAEFEVF